MTAQERQEREERREREWHQHIQQMKKEVFKCHGCGAEQLLIDTSWTVIKDEKTGIWWSNNCNKCQPGLT